MVSTIFDGNLWMRCLSMAVMAMERMVTGVTNHPPKRIEKSSSSFLCLTIFKLKSDVKYEYIQLMFECFHKYICVQCLITCEDSHVILWAIIKIAFPMKSNASCSAWALKNVDLHKKVCVFWKPFHYIIQLHSQTALVLSVGIALICLCATKAIKNRGGQ